MPPEPPPGRATLDFFAAQASARHRTRVLVVSFCLALVAVVALVYLALVVAAGVSGLDSLDPGGLPPPGGVLRPELLLLSAVAVAGVTGVGTAYHAIRLAGGGGAAVAELLGGTPVDRATTDPALRRLVNVAEEMAIASGLPVPRLYVLEAEPGINAFAAGYTPGHGVVAVTRGAVDRLERDELQGVVAHEFSHLLQGDTRIDLRLMAAVGGLTFLSMLGRIIVRGTAGRPRSRDERGGNGFLLVGLGLVLAGSFGALCGKLVRYAVARQREWLADASAVQFTRNPDGLAGALRKIAAEGSAIANAHAPEAAHLFFASSGRGLLASLLSTHPPIEERIRRLAPHLAGAPGAAPVTTGASPGSAPAASAAPVATLVHRPAAEHLERAGDVLRTLPPELATAAREPFGARAVACALLLDPASPARAAQLEGLAAGDPGLKAEVARLAPAVEGLSRAERIALLGLALPALDALSPGQAEALDARLRALAGSGATAGAFQWAVQRVTLRRLAQGPGAPPRAEVRSLDDAHPEALALLSAVAWAGRDDAAAAQSALDAGARALGVSARWTVLPRDRVAPGPLRAALVKLDRASPLVKARILDACVAAAVADASVTPEEAELVRALSAALGLPLPPALARE